MRAGHYRNGTLPADVGSYQCVSRVVAGYLISDPRNLFGWQRRSSAVRALAGRRGVAIWFDSFLGWYLKRGDKVYGRRGCTLPRNVSL